MGRLERRSRRPQGRRRGEAGRGGSGTFRAVVRDRWWSGVTLSALGCSGAFLALLLSLDAAAGTLTAARGALWGTLSLLVFLVLAPARVAAGEGWLAARTLFRTRRVRTDLLVSVLTTGAVARRVMLRDQLGGRVELDPQVLIANPPLWHRLDTDARTATAQGHLLPRPAALSELARQIDRETARAVFRISGLPADDRPPAEHEFRPTA